MSEILNISKCDIVIDKTSIPQDVVNRLIQKIKQLNVNSAESYKARNLIDTFNGDEDFELLKKAFIENAITLLNESSDTAINFILNECRFVEYWDDGYIHHHTHSHTSLMVGILYLDADEGCGDLLVQDPLAMVNWKNRTGKLYTHGSDIKISPEPGLIVVMPGYLIHGSEPKPPGKKRSLFAVNFINAR